MKRKIPNALLVWKQFEDVMIPRLNLGLIDRAVYSHLLRHSRLEEKHQFCFSIPWLAEGVRLCRNAVRSSLRRLGHRRALRILERSQAGHLVEVYLPEEIAAIWPNSRDTAEPRHTPKSPAPSLEEVDFFNMRKLRQAIHNREHGSCFYCLRQINGRMQSLDHVVPQAQSGSNSYRNLVCCCTECNTQKGERSAADHLSRLYREGRLTDAQLTGRFRALDDLAAGKLRPQLPSFPKSL